MNIDLEKLKELVELFGESNAGEMEVKGDSWKVFLKKDQRVKTQKRSEEEPSRSEESESNLVTITSEKVGSFYRKSSPEDSPCVEEGERVERGDQLGFIEVLGVMDEVQAEQEGEIVSFEVEEGERVEYGTPLLTMKDFSSGDED